MPLSLMVAVNATGPETGLQSRWYRQHRIPYALDRPEPDETPVSCRPNEVKAQFHLVQRQAELHDQLKVGGIGSGVQIVATGYAQDLTGDEARTVAREEHDGVGDVLRLAHPAQWRLPGHLLDVLVPVDLAQERVPRQPGCHRVHADAVGCGLHGRGAGKTRDPGLGRGVM